MLKLGSIYPRGILNLGPIYPRYVGPRLIIPGGTLDGGMLDLLHRQGGGSHELQTYNIILVPSCCLFHVIYIYIYI